jgi:uncharacterized protein (TIGR03435 family)
MVKNTTSGLRTGAQGLGRLRFQGATMADLASQLQLRVLDRLVIDQSGLTDRFDFTPNWTPDEFQFPRASAAQRAAVPTNPDDESRRAAGSVHRIPRTTRHETGGKKAPTDIVVIDKVSKPSEN